MRNLLGAVAIVAGAGAFLALVMVWDVSGRTAHDVANAASMVEVDQ